MPTYVLGQRPVAGAGGRCLRHLWRGGRQLAGRFHAQPGVLDATDTWGRLRDAGPQPVGLCRGETQCRVTIHDCFHSGDRRVPARTTVAGAVVQRRIELGWGGEAGVTFGCRCCGVCNDHHTPHFGGEVVPGLYGPVTEVSSRRHKRYTDQLGFTIASHQQIPGQVQVRKT